MRREITLNGPDEDLWTIDEVARALRVGSTTVKKLIRAGVFPRPIYTAEKVPRWKWLDVLWYLHGSEIRERLRPGTARKK